MGTTAAGRLPGFRDNTELDWAVVWGDGVLAAGVEYVAPTYTMFLRVVNVEMKSIHFNLTIAREAHRLTIEISIE